MMGAVAWSELGFCAIAVGDYESAKKHFHQGLTVPTAMMHLARPQLLVGSAYVNLFEGQIDAALENVQEAKNYIEQRQMKYYTPLVCLASGKVSLAKGEIEAAMEQFDQAEESAKSQGLLPMVWQAQVQIAETLKQVDRDQEAQEKYDLAISVFTEIEGFFKNPEYREVFTANINPI